MLKGSKVALMLTGLFCISALGLKNYGPAAEPSSSQPIEENYQTNASSPTGFFDSHKQSLARRSFNEVYYEDQLSKVPGMKSFKYILGSNNDFAQSLVRGAEKIARAQGLNVQSNRDRKKIIRIITKHIKTNYGTATPIMDAYYRNPAKVLNAFKSGDLTRIDDIYKNHSLKKQQSQSRSFVCPTV